MVCFGQAVGIIIGVVLGRSLSWLASCAPWRPRSSLCDMSPTRSRLSGQPQLRLRGVASQALAAAACEEARTIPLEEEKLGP